MLIVGPRRVFDHINPSSFAEFLAQGDLSKADLHHKAFNARLVRRCTHPTMKNAALQHPTSWATPVKGRP